MLQDTDLSLDFDLLKLDQISQYFKKIRNKYSEFEGSLKGVDVQMLVRQVPGGMLSNLESQLKQMNLEDKLEEVIQEIPRVRKDLGYLPLVTPVSQIIGAQALSNIIDGKRYEKLSIELTKLISGYYGKIFGKVKDDLKDKARLEMEPIKTRPADDLVNDFEQLMYRDKKVLDGQLRLVLLRSLGDAEVTADFTVSSLNTVLSSSCSSS